MYKLIIEDDDGKKTIVPLIRDEITIGRKEGNTIRLTERNVSRRHARLSRQNGAVFIEDLESYNGIRVNGDAIEGRVAVAEGDRIQIGDYMLGLRIEGEAERAAAARARPEPAKSEAARKEPAAAQQTDPVAPDALPAAPLAEDPLAAKAARLVCVSSNFPGLEFAVERPVMVIGRTADNDIAINHRSVSRHHARVIEEGGRYTVMDMQSANGVRVNGEEYGRIELRRGDLVDLGHVRLRFVAPGEKFDFSTDATVYDVSHTETSRGWIGAALALAVVAAVAFIVLRTVGTEREGESPTETAVAAPGAAPSLSVEEAAGRVSGIREAVGGRAWEDALALCDQLTGEGRLDVVDECALARAERGAKKAFDEAVAAETRNEHEHALELFGGIPAKSVYYEQAQSSPVYEQAKSKYEAQAAQRIDELVGEGACDLAERLASRVQDLVPTAASSEDKIKACREASAKEPVVARSIEVTRRAKAPSRPKATRRGRSASKRASARAKAASSAAATPQQKAHAQALLDRAWQAYREGYYARSLQLAEQVLSVVPSQQALSILGASACYLKRNRQAQSAFNRLDSQRRQLLRRVCERIGVTLE